MKPGIYVKEVDLSRRFPRLKICIGGTKVNSYFNIHLLDYDVVHCPVLYLFTKNIKCKFLNFTDISFCSSKIFVTDRKTNMCILHYNNDEEYFSTTLIDNILNEN